MLYAPYLHPQDILLKGFLLKGTANSEEFVWYKTYHGPLSLEAKIMARFWKVSQNKKIELLSTE